jgi:pilus assembly protein FimV
MLLMKSQVDKDSEIQQQLQLLVAQQAEMLAQQKARIEQEQQGTNFAGWWQNISSSSLTWVLLASLPTLFVLMAVLGWIKRRTRKSEQIVSAATAVPQQEPGYRSPLPPLDESLDFDESSLMTLDESLLDSGRGIRLDDEPVDLHDDMLLDTRADEFDDILLNDDDLLDSKDLFDASAMDDELLDDLLEQPATVADKEFDPDNILSGADLSALFESEDENPDDVFAQAVAEQLAEEQKQEAKADDGSDELIEEIELDEPDNDTTAPQSQVTETTGRFELDEVEEVEEVDFDSLLDELAVSKDDVEVEPEQTTKVESPAVPAALLDTPAEPAQFDSSELDEFAESLADEELSGTDTASESDETEIDIDALLAGNTSWPTETEPEVVSQEQKPQPEPVSVGAETALDFDEDDYPLSPEDVALLLSEDVTLQKETEFPEAAEQQVVEPADESTETEAADLWQELVEPAAESKLSEAVPDLDLQEDPTVSRVSAATLSVENPSKVLEQYPELEFSDDAALLEEPEDELLQSELPAEQHNQTELANEDIPAELEALDSFDFDALLADYTQEEPASRQQDEQVADAVLAELNATGAAPASAETKSWQDPELSVTESDDLEFSLQALDKLLDDSDEEDSSENAEPNLDVGLENYQDFIAAQHEPELDPAEQAYAADLDLIRAYIEIGEQEGAEHLIDKVLNSAAPEHIKQEAQSLKDQL